MSGCWMAVNQLLEAALPAPLPEPGWAKGIITYVSDDFDDFIPPGFDGNDEDDVSR